MNPAEELPLSIVIGSIQGWPATERCIRAAEVAAARVGGEVVVFDGSGNAPPPPGSLSDRTSWGQAPGESVFQLRMRGYRVSRGAIVAITEDHCIAPPDWGERILAAHAAHPEAAAIGGSVENGATERNADWASFLVVQVAVMSPIASGPATRLSGAVNVSYKRAALADIDDNDGMGAMDLLHQNALRARGEQLLADDSIRVAHDQSLDFRDHLVSHFNAGRTMSGFRRQQMRATDWIRFAGSFLVPWARFARVVVIGVRRGYGRQVASTSPAMLCLLFAQAVGQFLGYLRGPGDSAARLQ
jgi:hypothetical protein